MRMNQVNGGKPDRMGFIVKNAEASASILAGQPVVLAMNGTDDGLAVVLPSSSTAAKIATLRCGVATRTLATGDIGEAIVFGLSSSLLLQLQTRGASSDVWLTQVANAVGDYLTIDSTNNRFITTASTQKIVTNATTDTLAQVIPNPVAVLAQAVASFASSASATSDTRTAITASVKAFVRLM